MPAKLRGSWPSRANAEKTDIAAFFIFPTPLHSTLPHTGGGISDRGRERVSQPHVERVDHGGQAHVTIV